MGVDIRATGSPAYSEETAGTREGHSEHPTSHSRAKTLYRAHRATSAARLATTTGQTSDKARSPPTFVPLATHVADVHARSLLTIFFSEYKVSRVMQNKAQARLSNLA